jgi:hypothetical protein
MITNPTKQHTLRGHRPTRPTPRAANTAEHQATLAWRLTPRDRWIIRMLHEHRVLTIHQLTALAFPSARAARMRLLELYQWSVVDRFQPFVTVGTAPMHYLLAPAGATVLAAEDGRDPKDLGYRHDRALAVAHSLRLAHLVGVNEWFTALVHKARHNPHTTLTAWWSETRCARHFGDLVKPDAYGRWRHGDRAIEWFLEYDLGTEPLPKLAAKLAGYAALAQATTITTPLLIWLPTTRREAAARRQLLHHALHQLDHPHTVPVATAAADLLDPHATHPSPADPVWLPLESPRSGQDNQPGRRHLHHLLDAWPHLPPPITTDPATHTATPPTMATLPPRPMPPTDPRQPSPTPRS